MAKPKADRKANGSKPRTSKTVATLQPKKDRASPRLASTADRDQIKEEAKAQATVEPVYDEAIAAIILGRLADGETLNKICKTPGMPASRSVRRWALNPDHPFSPQYVRAREVGYHNMADEINDIGDDVGEDPGAVAKARLRVDSRKWLLSKALPKLYGDKLALTDADGGKLTVEIVRFGSENQASA